MATRRNPKLGQGLTEYEIVIVLVALALLVAVKTLGWRIEEKYHRGTGEIRFLDANDQRGSNP